MALLRVFIKDVIYLCRQVRTTGAFVYEYDNHKAAFFCMFFTVS